MRDKARRKALRERRTVLLAAGAALILCAALPACAPAGGPTVTEDDLTSPSAVQDAIEWEAGNGKKYAYVWKAEDVDATMAAVEAEKEAYYAEMHAMLDALERAPDEELQEKLTEKLFESLEQARQHVERIEGEMRRQTALTRQRYEAEHALDPVVSAQEAANRAGALFEQLYGIDAAEMEIELSCREADGLPDVVEWGAPRVVWNAGCGDMAGGVLDATTGEWLSTSCRLSEQQQAARAAAPPDCFSARAEDADVGLWNADDPSFAPLAERAEARLIDALSGSFLTGGAQVTAVRAALDAGGEQENTLSFYADCDNGKTYRVIVDDPRGPLLAAGEGPRFPLRGVRSVCLGGTP